MATRLSFSVGALMLGASVYCYSTEPSQGLTNSSNDIEVNNNWNVRVNNNAKIVNPFYVAIRNEKNTWVIDKLFNSPPKIRKSEDLEVFIASRDLQSWTNYYIDARGDCDRYEVKEQEYHSVCTSRLAERSHGLKILDALVANGKIIAYNNEKVKAAINNIHPQQAMKKIVEHEQANTGEIEKEQSASANKTIERKKIVDDQAAKRKAAPIGAKDWCEQTVKYLQGGIQVEKNYTCENYGVVTKEILRDEGWAIINKQTRNIGSNPQVINVEDLVIERSPR